MATTIQQMVMQPSPVGELFMAVSDIAGPKSYTTGGVKVYANVFALQSLRNVDFNMLSTPSGTYYAMAITPAGPGVAYVTVKWFVTATAAEVGNGVDLSAATVRAMAVGN